MIWIISLILIGSLAINLFQYQSLRKKAVIKEEDEELTGMIDRVRQSGASLPDLSIDLTSLAANNLKSVDAFRTSTTDLQNILSGSVSRFHKIDKVGQENVLSVQKRIDELQGFMESIEELNRHNSSVTDTVNLLEDISSQTSILALNASVEAARAGEHGKGFAVIAKSVRELASKSLTASETIKNITNQSKEKGKAIAEGVSESSQSLKEIFESINQIIDSLQEGLHTFEENSEIVDNIVSSANQLDSTVQQNLSSVRESSHIGIKLGIYLDELHTKSNGKRNGQTGQQEFIKPEHVLHFNFTNTFPRLLKFLNQETASLNFPEDCDKNIKPAHVYEKLSMVVGELNGLGIDLGGFEVQNQNIQPIDVLKSSVAFCEAIQRKSGRAMLDKKLVIQYMEWKKNREVTPSDVYFLVDHFYALLKGHTIGLK